MNAAHARARPVVVRLGIALDAPTRQSFLIEHRIVAPTAGQMRLFDAGRYMAMADTLGVLWPYAPKSARRVGRALHLTHVVVFEIAEAGTGPKGSQILRMRLVDVRTGRIPVDKRYLLPAGELSEATALKATQALRYMLLGERPGLSAAQREAQSALAQPGWQKTPDADATAEPDADAASGLEEDASPEKASAHARTKTAARQALHEMAQAQSLHTRMLKARRQLQGGLAIGFRQARISPSGAPCYCDNGGMAPGIPGLRLGAAVFFDPNTTHWGAHMQAGLGLASLPVTIGVQIDESQSIPWALGGDVAYRFFDMWAVSLVPHLGARYSRFAISRGPFVGMAYTDIVAGLELEPAPVLGRLLLRAGADFGLVVHTGLEAARLGAFESGISWQVRLEPSVILGPFQLGFEVRYHAMQTHYTGPTALYQAARYTDVRLDDATLELALHFGGTLW